MGLSFNEWAIVNDMTPARLSKATGWHYMAAYRALHGKELTTKQHKDIYKLTIGQVTPNDTFGVKDW